MLSPMSTFATRDFVAKLDVGPRVCGPVALNNELRLGLNDSSLVSFFLFFHVISY